MKHFGMYLSRLIKTPAAFGRLCVETGGNADGNGDGSGQPPSGGCVLKLIYCGRYSDIPRPAAFGRLCVETRNINGSPLRLNPAAFGRLCVETLKRG